MSRTTWIAIAAAVVIVLAIVLFWPRSKPPEEPKPTPQAATTMPAPPPPSMDTPTASLGLTPKQENLLKPLLKREDEAIMKIAHDTSMNADQKAAAIVKVRRADEKTIKKILSPEQYKTLALGEKVHDSELIQ